PQEWPAPAAPSTHLDQPPAERQREACSPGGEQHVGTGPQWLRDGEPRMPGITGCHARHSCNRKTAQLAREACSATQKFSGKRSQQRGGNCWKSAEHAFRIKIPPIKVPQHHLAVEPSGQTT